MLRTIIFVLILFSSVPAFAEKWVCHNNGTPAIPTQRLGDCLAIGICTGSNNSGLSGNCFEATAEEFNKADDQYVKYVAGATCGIRICDMTQGEIDDIVAAEEAAQAAAEAARLAQLNVDVIASHGTSVPNSVLKKNNSGIPLWTTITGTLETDVESVVDLQDLQGAVIDSQVPDNITITESDPEVATLTSGNFCKGTGTTVSCTDANVYLTTETDSAHDTCAEISGCVVGALSAEVDGSTTNEIEVVDEAYSAGNFNGGTTTAVSQDDLYDLHHISDTDDDGNVDTIDTTSNGFVKTTGGAGALSIDTATYLTAETDPQVGTLTNTKWCTTDGTDIDCTSDAPSGSGAPTTVDYLVGTADGGLSAEIVVGTSPGGELGGSWDSPTIDDSLSVTSWTLTSPSFAAGSASANSWPKFTSGTVLTTAEDGATELDDNVFYKTTDAGNRGYVPARNCIRQDASRSLPNDANENALFNSVTNGRITLETGTYLFQGMIYVTGMSATSGNALLDILGAGTATAGTWLWHSVGVDNTTPTNAATQTGSFTITQQSVASIQTAGTGTAMGSNFIGTVEITGAGTLIPSIDQVTASAATLAAGSYFCIERIGSTTLTNIGQWD